ncbi:MAG: response regulator transcription factor [Fervidobacterium sp.]|uniref:DNA-binding response regulator, OmpR family, contains REC and winged-helix (WHTH) domain n=1 Tax=Fervidobacterium gondwanense DSM 13020 TaxID=1121883 RepID=A0A1M7TCH5_FERGO|nr:response regulator transcription factor [Fervidobacterium gondwanense]SHN68425.1 DNA-binding response regulator, OmpR family, contains REC and winged-helix (wHTH) domain [Fervidobacterium gondwanense DSM 13020]
MSSTSNIPKIMIVEDDRKLRRLIELELQHAGYSVVTYESGIDAIENFGSEKPDLVILDIMLPDTDGYEVAKEIRKLSPDVLILMLTALGMKKDKLTGFESGADDYLTKPFDNEELLARIRALLRRKHISISTPIRLGNLEVYEDKHVVLFNGREVDLSKTEFELLLYLLKNHSRAVSKEEILDAVWGIDYYGSDNTVEVYINYLRKKLSPDIIKTVRGIGYKLVGEKLETDH